MCMTLQSVDEPARRQTCRDLNARYASFSSGVGVGGRLDSGRYLDRTLLRHLSAAQVETMADTISRLQNDRYRVDPEPHVERADSGRVPTKELTRR